VHADGFTETDQEKVTKRARDYVLPLLSGKENLLRNGRVRYIRDGPYSSMHWGLLGTGGKPVHVLRGYRLKSSYAPVGGIRYDGIWYVKGHSNHPLNDGSENHRLELELEKHPYEYSMDRLMQIPLPSQLDEWQVFEKKNAANIGGSIGQNDAYEWRRKNEEEREEREAWQKEIRRVTDFRISLGKISEGRQYNPGHSDVSNSPGHSPKDENGNVQI